MPEMHEKLRLLRAEPCSIRMAYTSQSEVSVVGKGNNSQKKEVKKPKKGAKAAPVKSPPPPKK